MILAENLSIHVSRRRAIGPVDLRVATGTIHGLLGPNGAGKSSIMRAILGLVAYTGRCEVEGKNVRLRTPERTRGMIEAPAFFTRASVRDNLLLVAPRLEISTRDLEILDDAGLTTLLDRPVRSLSLGQRQRLALCRVMLGEPSYLILDEPTNGLDPAGAAWFRKAISRAADGGATCLLSTHILAEAAILCGHITVIDDGRIVAELADRNSFLDHPEVLERFYLQSVTDSP
jgi:ABC-2 type transport system ATP-binding protein